VCGRAVCSPVRRPVGWALSLIALAPPAQSVRKRCIAQWRLCADLRRSGPLFSAPSAVFPARPRQSQYLQGMALLHRASQQAQYCLLPGSLTESVEQTVMIPSRCFVRCRNVHVPSPSPPVSPIAQGRGLTDWDNAPSGRTNVASTACRPGRRLGADPEAGHRWRPTCRLE
jgi:hypothetical protein